MKIQKIYQEILSDLETIDEQLKSKNGSQRLWQQMSVKYKLILPDIISVIKVGGKMSVGDEFDYRPELRQLKEAFLTWIFMNEDDITLISDHVENESKTILEATKQFETEAGIKLLISESTVYINRDDISEKQIALEKIWDAFERLKTLNGTDKKKSVESIIAEISVSDNQISGILNGEFRALTDIGNNFTIRHHEIGKYELPSKHYIEYLYFRMLSLVSLDLNQLNQGNDE